MGRVEAELVGRHRGLSWGVTACSLPLHVMRASPAMPLNLNG